MSAFIVYRPAALGGGGGSSSGIVSINSDTTTAQLLSVGTSGSDFAIVDAGAGSHVFNLPTASASNRGALSSADWSTFNSKQSTVSFGAVGSTPNANGGGISGGVITLQPADGSFPGLMTAGTQSFAGNKTFLSGVFGSSFDKSAAGTLAIGTLNATTINIGNAGCIINLQGTVITETTSVLNITNPVFTLNSGGSAGSASNSGMQVEENAVITGYVETSADRNSWILLAPNTAGVVTITPGAGGFTINQGSHNPVTIGTGNGLSLSTQVLSLQLASGSQPGALSAADWTTFNNKQAAGTYVTSLTVVTANGISGSFTAGATPALTLSLGAITPSSVNASGTVLGSNLSGTNTGDQTITLTGDVTGSGTGSFATTYAGTVPLNKGGTGQTTKAPAFDALSPMTTGGDLIYGGASGTGTRLANGSAGQVLASAGGTSAPVWTSSASIATSPTVQKFTSGSGTYTTPANVKYIRVRVIGSGGGGQGGAGSTSGGAGGNGNASTFGTSLLSAAGGGGGSGGGGGGPTVNSPAIDIWSVTGGSGMGVPSGGVITFYGGALGGTNPAGGLGFTGQGGAGAGGSGAANTGAGGGGGGGGAAGQTPGGSGGAGAFIYAQINSPSATYSYAVGAAGTAGTAGVGAGAGGAGGSGVVIVEEYYI